MLEQIPNITRVCQYLISSLDQIAVERDCFVGTLYAGAGQFHVGLDKKYE